MSLGDDIWLLLGAALGALAAFAIPYAVNVITRQIRKPDIALNPTAPSRHSGPRDGAGPE